MPLLPAHLRTPYRQYITRMYYYKLSGLATCIHLWMHHRNYDCNHHASHLQVHSHVGDALPVISLALRTPGHANAKSPCAAEVGI